jgi:hypothetical protein
MTCVSAKPAYLKNSAYMEKSVLDLFCFGLPCALPENLKYIL